MISKVTFTPATTGTAVTLHDPATTTTRYLSKIDGVVGPPAPRDVTRVLPGVDGIIDATQYVGERNITLEGELFGTSAGVSLSDLSTLSEGFYSTLLSPGKLTVTYENGTERFAYVKLSGGVESQVEGAARLVNYQVQFRCADPRWYSTTLKTTTLSWTTRYFTPSGSVVNSGTAPSPLTLAITAGASSGLEMNKITVSVPSAYSSLIPNTSSTTSDQVLLTSASPTAATTWTATAFGTGTEVKYLGFNWVATNTTTSSDVPGTSSKWIVDEAQISVAASKTKTLYSATRSGTYTGTGNALALVSAQSEFPYAYPGTNTVSCVGAISDVVASPTGSMVVSWYDAYW